MQRTIHVTEFVNDKGEIITAYGNKSPTQLSKFCKDNKVKVSCYHDDLYIMDEETFAKYGTLKLKGETY